MAKAGLAPAPFVAAIEIALSDQKPFRPLTELELALTWERTGSNLDRIAPLLVNSTVFVLADRAMPAGVWEPGAQPLYLSEDQQTFDVAVFTSRERLAGWPERHPQFAHPHEVAMRWLLRSLDASTGMMINDGWETRLRIIPAGVARMRQAVEGGA